jgi:lipopolysaccharide biosynthesis protein
MNALSKSTPIRAIAFYQPLFHPIPDNDSWWGTGFTEWTNVTRARKRFPFHDQPRRPADLGYYDLRVPETRAAQAALAQRYGIEGFCYYHYWFAGRRLLERPFNEVISSGQPDFPVCVCWANQSWTGIWHGAPNRTLMEQTYPGDDDHRAHFDALLPAFTDRRYIRVDDKPLFVVYQPDEIPHLRRFVDLWQELAARAGLKGLHFAGVAHDVNWRAEDRGFDAVIPHLLPPLKTWYPWHRPIKKAGAAARAWFGVPTVYQYGSILPGLLPQGPLRRPTYPCVIPNWDNTPRSGRNGRVLHAATPELFRVHFRQAVALVNAATNQHPIVFIKSWNEWAEGNYLEPDGRYGHAYLEVVKQVLAATGPPSTTTTTTT